MVKLILGILSFVVAINAVPSIIDEWASFKANHGKAYKSTREEQYRFRVYLSNKEMIEDHNAKYIAGEYSYELEINQFGDKLPEEISALMNGFNRSGEAAHRKPGLKFQIPHNSRIPSSVDWRMKGAVTPVKDQGQCGSCWAFSTTGSLEGQMFLKTGELVSLSEQNLVDCAGEYGNKGCDGGLMDQAFEYINGNGGLDSEDSYPYEGRVRSCRYRSSDSAATLSNYVDMPHGDEEALKKAVATVGPISIAINAGLPKFAYYRRGVFEDYSCDPNTLNHGVLLVGYGSENGQDYWLVKNSWNTNWGDEGYVKIARNQGNMCGVATMASYPIV